MRASGVAEARPPFALARGVDLGDRLPGCAAAFALPRAVAFAVPRDVAFAVPRDVAFAVPREPALALAREPGPAFALALVFAREPVLVLAVAADALALARLGVADVALAGDFVREAAPPERPAELAALARLAAAFGFETEAAGLVAGAAGWLAGAAGELLVPAAGSAAEAVPLESVSPRLGCGIESPL